MTAIRRLCWLAAVGLAACFRDDGVVDTGADGNKPVLARFQGQISPSENNSPDFDYQRTTFFRNPRVGLVWEFVGTKVEGATLGSLDISLTSPFNFSIGVTALPPPEVERSSEPVFGHFWLYSDRNTNNLLDRILHPEVAARMRVVDSLRDVWTETEAAFRETAVLLPEMMPRSDTFHLEGMGTLYLVSGGKRTLLFEGKSASDTGTWNHILFHRFRLLRNNSHWENFFALRKTSHDYSLVRTPLPDRAYRLVIENWTRLAPKPGRESEFQAKLHQATMSYLLRYQALVALNRESQRKGWADYPYYWNMDGVEDYVVGRSRWYHVVYFPDSASLRVAVDAERSGSFLVENLERLHRGYNLLRCDDQYRCRVLGSEDTIFIDLGMSDAFFDPSPSPLAYPIPQTVPVSKAVRDSLLDRLEGGFRYRTFGPVTVIHHRGGLWADIPRMGFFRLMPADSTRFFVPGRDLQIEFALGRDGTPYKLMLYSGGERAVATRENSLALVEEARGKADARMALPRFRLPDSLMAGLPRAYGFAGDTLVLDGTSDGDSLRFRLPGKPVQVFHPVDDSGAASLHTGDRLAFLRNGQGTVMGLSLQTEVARWFLPALGYDPRMPADLFPRGQEADSLVSASEGSGKDSYPGLAGRRRYACGGDSAFLRPGDGWVASLGRGETGDSISLAAGGDNVVLRLEGLSGRRAAVEFRVCREPAGPAERRLMLGLRGRRDESSAWKTLAEPHWVRLTAAGDTLALGSFPVPSEKYEVELYRVSTPDPDFYFAFDRYRVFSN